MQCSDLLEKDVTCERNSKILLLFKQQKLSNEIKYNSETHQSYSKIRDFKNVPIHHK